MIIFNTFSNRKRQAKIPETDILIWAASLVKYKQFGYTTKIYCTPNDLPFLVQYHLIELYDEIDTVLLQDNEQLNKIDENIFWSTRKIEAMYHELFELQQEAIYVDTDILMRVPFKTETDVLVWSPEPRATDGNTIYVPWRYLSKPKGYQMPDYILDCPDAYNCGVWYFKNKEVFKKYREEYYKFCINNPGETKHDKGMFFNKAIFPCNAEQRILKAVLTKENQTVSCVMAEKGKGLSFDGNHYFWYRVGWNMMNKPNRFPTEEIIQVLNNTLIECIMVLKSYTDCSLYNFWNSRDWLKGFENTYLTTDNKTPIKKYY